MKLWDTIKKMFSGEQPINPWEDGWWWRNSLVPESKAGVEVDPTTALNYAAVWACVRVISEDVASLPLHLYQRMEKGKKRATNHPLYTLMHDLPNPEMSAMSFRETQLAHLLTWGNCYAEIERSVGGRVKALWPIAPDRVEVYRQGESGEIYYKVRLDQGEKKTLSRDQMFHVPGLSYNGLVGYSPITKMREALGLMAAMEEFGARFFGQGTHPGIIISHPGKISPTATENLRTSLTNTYSGLGKTHRLMLLEEGMKPEKIGVPPEDAQFLESRKFQLAEICRIYRVPLHKVQELTNATFSNIEHQSLEYVTGTLRPWLVRYEQACNWQFLLTDLERRRYFWEHLVDGLLRGDIKSRYDAYAVGRQWGWLSADDIREYENMNPLPEGKGEIYLYPLNFGPVKSEEEMESEPESVQELPPDKQEMADYWQGRPPAEVAFGEIFKDSVGQIFSREAKTLRKIWDKSNGDWNEEVEKYYDADIRDYMIRKIRPAIQSLIVTYGGPQEMIEQETARFIDEHIREMKTNLLEQKDKAIDSLMEKSERKALEIIASLISKLEAANAYTQAQ